MTGTAGERRESGSSGAVHIGTVGHADDDDG